MRIRRVAVIGAGVIGLTSAVMLAEGGYEVAVYADQIPGATSLAAGASWGPYLVKPYDRVQHWSTHTLAVLTELAAAPGYGVAVLSGVEASRSETTLPDWAAALPDVRECHPDSLPAGFQSGWRYTIPVVDMPLYLAALIGRLRTAGGVIIQRAIGGFDELAGHCDTVVNASGLGSAQLAADDSVYPIRGQLVVVANPGITEFFSEDTGESAELTHFLPHGDKVILGGTALPRVTDNHVDADAGAAIIARCAAIDPRLARATVIEQRVGFRPTRPEIRVELDHSHTVAVVHNYGHGGAGVSLSWGCAQEVVDLIAGA